MFVNREGYTVSDSIAVLIFVKQSHSCSCFWPRDIVLDEFKPNYTVRSKCVICVRMLWLAQSLLSGHSERVHAHTGSLVLCSQLFTGKLLKPVNCQNEFTGIFEKIMFAHDLLTVLYRKDCMCEKGAIDKRLLRPQCQFGCVLSHFKNDHYTQQNWSHAGSVE